MIDFFYCRVLHLMKSNNINFSVGRDFFLKMFHQKQFIHYTRAEANRGFKRRYQVLWWEIENGDNTEGKGGEVVIYNYLQEVLGIINDPVRPESLVWTSELSGASWLYNWKSFRQLYSLTLVDHVLVTNWWVGMHSTWKVQRMWADIGHMCVFMATGPS